MLIYFVRPQLDDGQFARTANIALFSSDFRKIMQSFGNFKTAFFAHPFVAPIVAEMEKPTRNRTLKLTWAVNITCAIITYSVGLLSYLFFTGIEPDDNIWYSLDPYAVEVIVGKFAILVVSLCSTAFFVWFCSQQIAAFIHPLAQNCHVAIGVIATAMTFVYISLNLIGDFMMSLMYEIGSIAFSLLAFVLPPVFYLAQHKFSNVRWGVAALFVLVGGLMLMLIGTVLTILDLIGG
jgi:amino acid permease